MALFLDSVNVHNDDSGETYRLVIKDGEEIVRHTNAIAPTRFDGLGPPSIPITGSLTLIAEKV